MKNFLKFMLLAVASFTIAFTAQAQRGFDTYAATRTLIVSQPQLFSGWNALTNGTNAWVDVKSLDGIAKLDIFANTNVANSSFTVTIQGSNDSTNIVSMPLSSVASSTAIVYTNNYYGGGANAFSFTNTYNLAGALVTPTSATAGFATAYLNPAANPFTNSLVGITPAQGGITSIGISIGDAPRYMRLIVIPAGAATNFDIGAVLTSGTHTSSYPF